MQEDNYFIMVEDNCNSRQVDFINKHSRYIIVHKVVLNSLIYNI